MSAPLPPSSVQEEMINVAFNAQLLDNLLAGIYTVVYFGTLYIYASRKSFKNWTAIAFISLSYLSYILANSVQWYLTKVAFVDNGTSQGEVFVAIYDSTNYLWATYVDNTSALVVAGLADGLLLWRCFNIYNRSFRAIALPSFLIFCEIVDLSITIMIPLANSSLSNAQITILNTLIGASLFVTFATTLVTTLLIAYRIHALASEARQDMHTHSGSDGLRRGLSPKARFNHIIAILMESAAVYAVATLGMAIMAVIPETEGNEMVLNAIDGYLGPFYVFIAGVAPTIMVARVALATDNNRDTSMRTRTYGTGMSRSNLEFRRFTAPHTTMSLSISGRMSPVGVHSQESDDPHVFWQEPKDEESETKQIQGGVLHIA